MSQKVDLRKEWKHLYQPSSKKPELVEVPPMNYLMIDGKGDPNTSQEYKDAVSTLFPLAYAIKFAVKKRQGIDYAVMPLEGLWWGTPQEQTTFTSADKEKWFWTSLILQPEWVTAELVDEMLAEVARKKNPPAINKVRFETLEEGLSVQMMHLGSYDSEGPTSEAIHKFAEDQGFKLDQKHHEIYLKDPSRTAPEKLMTVLRHPVRKI